MSVDSRLTANGRMGPGHADGDTLAEIDSGLPESYRDRNRFLSVV
jgi:hypothetical protein